MKHRNRNGFILSESDRLWRDKQIIALTKQGFTTKEIMERYKVHSMHICKVRREAGIYLRKPRYEKDFPENRDKR